MNIEKPCMSNQETQLFTTYIKDNVNYLEFGCGGSTVHALINNYKLNVTSIETDLLFIDQLNNELNNDQSFTNRYKLIHADIGNVKEWGAPANQDEIQKWLNYTLYIWNKLQGNFDLILIDGRFRLCISLPSLIYMPQAVFIFHDFTVRPHYSPLLKYIDTQDVVDSMIVYRRKAGLDCKNILSEAIKYLFDYR